MEISFLNNIKKYNSVSDKTSIKNVMNEAFRDAENYKNNVNQNLTELNKVLIRNLDVLKQQYEDTEVSKNSKDVISVVSNIQTGDFEGKYNADLTYFLKLQDWEKYYRENLKFLKEKFGENARCVYAVVHFDESTPHLHSMWTFSQENKQEKIEVNYKKIQNALKTDFTRKNAKKGDKALKAETAEYKEEFQKFCEENKQKKIEKQIKKLQNKKSEKGRKFETGTSPLNRSFFREINGEFKQRMEYQKEMLKLKKRLEVFSSERTEFVVTRTKKVNNSEDLDIRKRDLEDDIENAEFNLSVTKTDSERSALRKYVALLTKSELVEDKKTISKDEFLKRFEEYATEVKETRINRTFSKIKELVNVKKKLEEKKQDKNIKNKYKKTIKKELENINEALENVDFDEVEKKIKKYETSEKEKIYDEIKSANERLREVRENIEEMCDERNEIYSEILELETKIESRKKEAEKTYIPSAERIKELEKDAIEKAESKAKIEIEKKNAELKELQKNIEQQRKIQQNNEISIAEYRKKLAEIKKENEEIEKKVAEKRNLKIEEIAEKTLKTAPVSNAEIDDYIEKNQEKFQDLIEKRQEKIENEVENEVVEQLKQDEKKAFLVFKEFVREHAKTIVYKDLIDFKTAKNLTIQALAEIKATSTSFFADFLKNLKNKVQELITMRQNSEKRPYTNEKRTR